MKRLGVIGGIGPLATVYFYNSLIELCKKRLNSNFPHIIINNVETWKFVSTIGNRQEMANFLIKEIKEIEEHCDIIVIVCNTAHSVIEEIKKEIKRPIIEIHKEVVKKIKQSKIKKVGVLGTALTLQSNLYFEEFEKNGIKYEVLSALYESGLDRFSKNGIAKRITPSKLKKIKEKFLRYVDFFKQQGCKGVLLGCTDYSFFISKKDVKGIKLFSSTDILAEAVIDELKKDLEINQTQTI
jgi:aspartate racemase